ncbi:hypothetical protein EV368DRAFT_45288 [Lentinula lateritia]|nr:hypothetical protein EV368DRAFT_45288 [Lentinula lateritia]
MLPYLELIPRDILEYIAFLVVLTPIPVSRPPQELLNLLLTSSTLYSSLCISSAPHLYARIFRSTFDFDINGPSYDATKITDSGLTLDLVSRYRLLRRVRRMEFSKKMMLEDLRVAMQTVIESKRVNETHLKSAGFSEFTFSYAEQCLTKHQIAQTHAAFDYETNLILWLLALTWSRGMLCLVFVVPELTLNRADDVTKIAQETRENFLILLRPLDARDYTIVQPIHQETSRSELCVRDRHSPKANCPRDTSIPSAASAAIILYFVLQEAGCTKVSPRLLFGRVVDFGGEREGPTMEAYYSMTNYRTLLPGDEHPDNGTVSNPRISNPTRITHDPQFFNLMQSGSNAYCSLPDVITGLWEGVYMVSCVHMNKEASSSPSTPDFICKKFMQCSLVLFFHFGTPDNEHLVPGSIGGEVDQWTANPRDFSTEMVRNSLSARIMNKLRKFDSRTALRYTAQNHDSAWGGFNFAGKLKRDGTIVMKRESKYSTDAELGIWIFEGNIRYGSVFAGTWRSSNSPASGIHGIFSLGKNLSPSLTE